MMSVIHSRKRKKIDFTARSLQLKLISRILLSRVCDASLPLNESINSSIILIFNDNIHVLKIHL